MARTRTGRPLHVGIDGRELLGRSTGVGQYLRQIMRQWTASAEWTHRLTVFTPDAPSQALQDAFPDVDWRVESSEQGGTLWEQVRLPRAMARSRLDVFFAVGYTAPLLSPCPFVVVIHDVSFFAHPEWFSPREGRRRRWLTRLAAGRASTVITVSAFSADEIVRWLRVDRSRLRLASPGAPHPRIGSAQAARGRLVLYVGSLFNRRRIPDLIRAFSMAHAEVPDARLVIVGDNRTYPRIDPCGLAADHGIADAVEWRDYVPDAELDRLYGEAAVFAFLSDYEGFAMTPMEAIARGVPALLFDTPVAREVYGDGARLVEPTAQAAGEALVELLMNPDARDALASAGRSRLDGLSWRRSARSIQDAIEAAASSP